MSEVIKKIARTLMTLSPLEHRRVLEVQANPLDLSAFNSIEAIIQHSLKKPELVKVHTPMGNPIPKPLKSLTPVKRSFCDQEIVNRLIKYRDRIPLSARILRPQTSRDTLKPS